MTRPATGRAVTTAAMARAVSALRKAGAEIKGVRLYPDGRIDLLTSPSGMSPDDDIDHQITAWAAGHGKD